MKLNRTFLLLGVACVALSAVMPDLRAQNPPGLPEPGLVIFGPIVNRSSNLPVQPASIAWQVSGGTDSATINATLVNVNGQPFFVARVPFETRSAGGVNFTRTPGTFELKTASTTYNRSAACDGQPATIMSSSLNTIGTFTFSAADRGVVERVVLGTDKAPISNVDTDGDGMTDQQELVAGTDPNNPNSVFKVSTDVSMNAQGGLVIKWASVAGRTYSIQRTTNLGVPFTPLAAGLPATPPLNSYTDATAKGVGVLFYRISVAQ